MAIRWRGAIAGLASIALYLLWLAFVGWGGTQVEFWRSVVVLGGVAVAAGWLVAPFGNVRGLRIIAGIAAYPLVGYLVYLPIGVIGTVADGLSSGRIPDASSVALHLPGLIAYAFVAAVYVVPFGVPFGCAWIAAFWILQNGAVTRVARLPAGDGS